MSVVAGIVADSEGRADLCLGLVSAGAQADGQGWSGGEAADTNSSWRAQFAALVAGAGMPAATDAGNDETGTGTELGEAGTVSADRAATGNTASAATSLATSGSALRWRLATGQNGGAAASTAPWLQKNISASQPPGSDLQAIAAGKSTATTGAHPSNPPAAHQNATGKDSKRETTSGETASETVQVLPGSYPAQIPPEVASWAAGVGITGAGSIVAPVSASAGAGLAGNRALSSTAFPDSAGASSAVASGVGSQGDSGHAGVTDAVKAESSVSSVKDGQSVLVALPGSAQAQTGDRQYSLIQEQPQRSAQSTESASAGQLSVETEASGADSSQLPSVRMAATKPDFASDTQEAEPVAVRMPVWAGPAVAVQDGGPPFKDETTVLAADVAALASSPAATRIGANGERAPLERAARTSAGSQTRAAFALPNVGTGPQATHSSVGGSLGTTDVLNPAGSELSGAASQVSPPSGKRVAATESQQVSVEGQNQAQAHPVNQEAESSPASSLSNQSTPGTAQDVAIPIQTPAALSKQIKPAGTGTASAPVQASARSSSRFLSVEHAISPDQAQPSASAADTSSLLSSQAFTRDAASRIGGTSPSATDSQTGSAGHETFAALDSASDQGSPSWIHAGARHAEAGFQDPALGWVGVRADVSAGGVHATVIPGSTDAAQALGGHMAGLSAYLSDERAHVETLTLAVPESGEAGMATGQNSGQGMNQGENQGPGQGSGQSGFSESPSSPRAVTPAIAGGTSLEAQSSAIGGTLGTAAGGQTQQGAHISVMA